MSWELIYGISGLFILPVFIWAIIASVRVNSVLHKYQRVKSSSDITARGLAEQVARENGLNITVERASNFAGDHYDSSRKVIALTAGVIDSNSVTALAVAAHECGHALQDKENFLPLRTRHFVIGLTNFASKLLMPLIIVSIIVSLFMMFDMSYEFMKWIILTCCVIYGLSALVNLITLPTEFDASRRAKVMLDQMGIIRDESEKRAVGSVLGAAAQTYVVAFAISLIYFLRTLSYFMLLFGRRD